MSGFEERSPPPVSSLSTVIVGRERIDHVRALLYRVYHDEQGWSPPIGNPSRQIVERLACGRIGLTDRHDRDATWVGLVCAGRIVGCIRLIERREHASLELERYYELPDWILRSSSRWLEVNRLAVLPGFRGGPGPSMLIARAIELALQARRSLITTATRTTARYVGVVAGMRDTGLRFRYHPEDAQEVMVLLLDGRDRMIGFERIHRTLASGSPARPS